MWLDGKPTSKLGLTPVSSSLKILLQSISSSQMSFSRTEVWVVNVPAFHALYLRSSSLAGLATGPEFLWRDKKPSIKSFGGVRQINENFFCLACDYDPQNVSMRFSMLLSVQLLPMFALLRTSSQMSLSSSSVRNFSWCSLDAGGEEIAKRVKGYTIEER